MAEISVTVSYFAMLREQANKSEEVIAVSADSTFADIYHQLQQKYHFTLGFDAMRCASNDRFQEATDRPDDGDRIVFIPPVAGG